MNRRTRNALNETEWKCFIEAWMSTHFESCICTWIRNGAEVEGKEKDKSKRARQTKKLGRKNCFIFFKIHLVPLRKRARDSGLQSRGRDLVLKSHSSWRLTVKKSLISMTSTLTCTYTLYCIRDEYYLCLKHKKKSKKKVSESFCSAGRWLYLNKWVPQCIQMEPHPDQTSTEIQ